MCTAFKVLLSEPGYLWLNHVLFIKNDKLEIYLLAIQYDSEVAIFNLKSLYTIIEGSSKHQPIIIPDTAASYFP